MKLLWQLASGLPDFRPSSHGFRPGRGCHTALKEIERVWSGTVWWIEGDISKCFDRLDHQVLLSILGERIRDNRFLRLIAALLKAGYLEDWRYHESLSGVPQGSIGGPILSKLSLDRLDHYVEHTLLPAETRGERRRIYPPYRALAGYGKQLKTGGEPSGGQSSAPRRCRRCPLATQTTRAIGGSVTCALPMTFCLVLPGHATKRRK